MTEKEKELFSEFLKANGFKTGTFVEDSLIAKAFKAGIETAKK